MGFKDWRTRHSMKDPVRGEFRVTGRYPARGGSPHRRMLTGVVSAPGVAPTAGEHLEDYGIGRGIGRDVLPALVDRDDPSRFVVLWDELAKPDWRTDARTEAQQAAARMQSGATAAPHVYDDTSGEPVPDWAKGILDEVFKDGVPRSGSQVRFEASPQVIDLTAGHLSAADAADLTTRGEQASAVLTSIADVDVPQFALPGPTASLADLTLQVTRQDGRTYTAQTRLGFRNAERRALIGTVGSVLPVRVDPADPGRVAVDVPAIDRC